MIVNVLNKIPYIKYFLIAFIVVVVSMTVTMLLVEYFTTYGVPFIDCHNC